MQFTNPVLNKTAMPDPLWLYKTATSLIHKEAESRAAASGQTIAEEASVLMSNLHSAINTPDWAAEFEEALKEKIPSAKARREAVIGFEPLIKSIADEATALYEAFGIKQSSVTQEVAQAVLKTYSEVSALVQMERTGKISAEELKLGALLKMKDLNRFGANGLAGFWNVFDSEKKPLLERLKSNPKEFVPKWLQGVENSSDHRLTRAKYFASEYEHVAPKTQEEFEAFLNKIVPELIGPEYQKAMAAKEQLLSHHITSGKMVLGDDIFVQAAAMHRNNDYLQGKAVKKVDSAEFEYVNEALNPSKEVLARIRAGEHPETFLEQHAAEFNKIHSNQDKIAEDLRASIGHVSGKGSEGVPATVPEKATKSRSRSYKSTSSGGFAEGVSNAAKQTRKFTNARLGATGLFGIALVDGLANLRPKDRSDPEKPDKSVRFSRVAEVAIGAAGIAAAWMLKDKDIAKWVGKGSNKGL